ncbi:RNA 2',3'-cyclic phosphodiesterase [Bacillus nakamurai]|uniref:RNA 2',3'-cyclic phosphodiesterase n=1 Tax=Bacillus nakamurai TaxID=1793963 RepID=UPI001E4CE691|nr:RNA 2',3'-cyclic phosphodiesterase [Bacillus nakamurai]MCC9021325.1 RNA 2',3'-cyclic phosphodiesterase [Bacillus nakamurai]
MKASLPHYFIGIPIPADIAEPIWEAARKEPVLTFKKWVHPLDYHITLIFLGAADEARLAGLKPMLADIAALSQPFTVQFQNLEFFGAREQPRVLHLEPERNDYLFDLREKTKQAVQKAGFQVEKRPYHPHMTMARKWSGDEPFPHHVPFESGRASSTVTRFSLFQTHLDRSPKYEEIAQFQLT